ncbi:MAG: hypothetical protein GX613_16930 [Chloroflexi bacterium]|nr:hypothetical protein [Chloroflexota bacterium]
MQAIQARFKFLFQSTKGLILVAIAVIALVTAIWGMLSGPMAELGVREVVVDAVGFDMDPVEREGRLVILYHSIAMAVIAILVYMITGLIPMKEHEKVTINASVTLGYMTTMFFGMAFAYFGHNWAFHGVYLLGLSIMFFTGIMLAKALWPWRKEYRNTDPAYAHLRGVNLERLALFVMAVATLGSALFGAIAGANYGNGFTTFLAEDTIRWPDKTDLQFAIVGHLHIMLALMAVAMALIVGRWFNWKGLLHKISMPIMIVGTMIMTAGTWAVVPMHGGAAHMIIYAGSTFVLLAGLFLVIFGFSKIIRERLAEQGIEKASFGQGVKALLHDPLKFGMLWQMVYMNFCTSFIGIFVAVRLDEIFRIWPWRDERLILTGHWHILSGIIATIILLYYADMAGLKGKVRQWFGWSVIIGSDVAFGAVTIFELKRLFVSELNQQPVTDVTMLLADIGLALVLVVLAALMVWRLVDLFKERGRWHEELEETGYEAAAAEKREGLISAQELAK